MVRSRRGYVATGAALLLTPVIAGPLGFLPLVIALPILYVLLDAPEGFQALLYWGLGFGVVVWIIAWLVHGRFLAVNGLAVSLSGVKNSGAIFGQLRKRNYGWLRSVVDLAILFVMVEGYLRVWMLGVRIYSVL